MGRRQEQTFLQRRHPNGRQTHEKSLPFTQHQGNTNQHQNEIPRHSSRNGYNKQVRKGQMLERMWRKGNPLILLVGMQADAATLENTMEAPQKS